MDGRHSDFTSVWIALPCAATGGLSRFLDDRRLLALHSLLEQIQERLNELMAVLYTAAFR